MFRVTLLRFFLIILLFPVVSDVNAAGRKRKKEPTFDKQRKGLVTYIGIGAGYSYIMPGIASYGDYTVPGLAMDFYAGYGLSDHSVLTFGYRSNIFVQEVGQGWKNWADKMKDDNLAALGAILVSPFVFPLIPLFASHAMLISVEYSYFLNESAPSFLVSGAAGFG